MPATPLRKLTAPLRAYGPVVFEGYEEPHAELMALVWGPRFDRLADAQQQRVRQLILRHRSRWDNARAAP